MVAPTSEPPSSPAKAGRLVEDFIQKLAAPSRTGDKSKDAELKSVFRLLGQVVSGCVARPDAILPVHEAYSEYVRTSESQYQPDCPPAEQFSGLTVISKVEETFLVKMIVSCTDLSPTDLKSICRRAEALSELVEGVFQVGPVVRMSPKLQIRDVMRRFLMARRLACGSPLTNIKKNGGVDSTGGIVWKAVAAYQPIFGEHGRLVKLKHRSGAVVDVDAVFTKDTPLRYAWSDWRACFPNPPMADVKLHLYFKKSATGPWKTTGAPELSSPKSKKYEELVDIAFNSWKDDKSKVEETSVVDDAVKEVKAARDGATSERRKRVLAEAREKGMAALKKRRESQDVKYG
jgi:hypothetical protein